MQVSKFGSGSSGDDVVVIDEKFKWQLVDRSTLWIVGVTC
jgi:hypothetical protein